MSSSLFNELELVVGKEKMKKLCEQYLLKYVLDNSGNRTWKDCSGEDMAIYPSAWRTPEKKSKILEAPGAPLKDPPRIVRYDISDLT